MSVIVKGMEMPKNCKQCFYKASGCKENKHNNGRPNDCPLIEAPRWIPVTERLPEEYEYVLCKTDYGMEVGYHRDEWGQDEWTTGELGSGTIDVTHWMQLPQQPEESGGK